MHEMGACLASPWSGDGHASYPRAIRETLGKGVIHHCSRYLHDRLEQDHRGIKQRYRLMHEFGSVASAPRFCSALRRAAGPLPHAAHDGRGVPLAEQRLRFVERLAELATLLAA